MTTMTGDEVVADEFRISYGIHGWMTQLTKPGGRHELSLAGARTRVLRGASHVL